MVGGSHRRGCHVGLVTKWKLTEWGPLFAARQTSSSKWPACLLPCCRDSRHNKPGLHLCYIDLLRICRTMCAVRQTDQRSGVRAVRRAAYDVVDHVGRQCVDEWSWTCSPGAAGRSVGGRSDRSRRARLTVRPTYPGRAGVTFKCLIHEKSARKEIITELICFSLLKYRRPHKSLRIIGSPPPEKSPLADNLSVKIRLSQAAAGQGRFLAVNCRPGQNFLVSAIL